MQKINIESTNSNTWKVYIAGEEIDTPTQEAKHYFDAKTYKKPSMRKEITFGIIVFFSVLMIAGYAFHPEDELTKLKRITEYDYFRKEQLKEIETEKTKLEDCKKSVEAEMGQDKDVIPCSARTSIIPEAKAESNTWTGASAISEVPERKVKDGVIMEHICAKAPNSPLCGNWELYHKLKKITEERMPEAEYGRVWEILIGISYAESHVGQNYAKDNVWGTCYGRNNWGGGKYKINDDNTRVYTSNKFWGYNTTTRFTDAFWCNLFPFESIEEYWISKVNGMRYGYKSCFKSQFPIRCVAFQYVWDPRVAEPSWILNVRQFLVSENVGQP